LRKHSIKLCSGLLIEGNLPQTYMCKNRKYNLKITSNENKSSECELVHI
jgi:hypothetical protein